MNRPALWITVAVVCAAGLAAWQFRGRLPPAGFLGAVQPALAPASALRKCLLATRIVYTDGQCPAGSREQAVGDDRVSIVPATPVPTPASAAIGLPNARDLLGRPEDGNLRDKRMQQQIGD